ncbi:MULTISPECIES: DNA-formamidopyrimidine glycosylase family protein [unclassified Arthrobacter]|uniref:Fpg/Nei family DNA glycosylase n=1 Tax=unclassified Arthrobacter TaxID=235627 RepID=UPI001CFF9457|nr:MULTISPECIES: DNA-formamidopyrimidine glycosylase family protein [unclassified Arthrobacter]MCB5281944.1 Endonuclease 8 1 [Arthrobacter sp. ES1]WGZ78173.1 DNA-formamidopyrimidine glycosylase family protein [Arthrobacter sp. EM1]
MPEGHSVHRLARQFGDVFTGEQLAVSSPQGRFVRGAALLDGHTLTGSTAHGKHLFLAFGHGLALHVHLGLYGAWDFGGDAGFRGASSIGAPRKVGEREIFDDGASAEPAPYSGPPAPVGAVRVRLAGVHGWADLRGATTCEVVTEAEAAAVLARLGPDPLRNLPGDRDSFVAAVRARRTPIAALLMDQKVIAGVGNVYRAELLFRQGLDPWLPGRSLSAAAARELWDDSVAVMSDGVRDGRIITTPPDCWAGLAASGNRRQLPAPDESHFVYRRQGLDCRNCGTTVALTDLGARKLYWCPSCQR